MTLIDYLNRVHFAESILEEAIWAELDQRRSKKFCLIIGQEDQSGEVRERICAGLPRRTQMVEWQVNGSVPTESGAHEAAQFFKDKECDVLLAFGRGYVINLAKAVRILVSHDTPLADFSEAEGGALRITNPPPDLIAIPTLKGFAAGFSGLLSVLLDNGTMIDISSRSLVPTVTIGDPTVALREPVDVQAHSAISSVTACTEAVLSPNYNPPANGIALDGLNRGLHALKAASDNATVEQMRELMAASMNAAMAQQKGLGATHAIASSICAVTKGQVEKGAFKRLLLPKILAHHAETTPGACLPLAKALDVSGANGAVAEIETVFQSVSLPERLADLDIQKSQITDCAEMAVRHRALVNSPSHIDSRTVRDILLSIY